MNMKVVIIICSSPAWSLGRLDSSRFWGSPSCWRSSLRCRRRWRLAFWSRFSWRVRSSRAWTLSPGTPSFLTSFEVTSESLTFRRISWRFSHGVAICCVSAWRCLPFLLCCSPARLKTLVIFLSSFRRSDRHALLCWDGTTSRRKYRILWDSSSSPFLCCLQPASSWVFLWCFSSRRKTLFNSLRRLSGHQLRGDCWSTHALGCCIGETLLWSWWSFAGGIAEHRLQQVYGLRRRIGNDIREFLLLFIREVVI